MTSLTAQKTAKKAMFTKVQLSGRINSPKPNSIAVSCNAITDIARGHGNSVLTDLGHLANCKGGIIDATILSGKANTLESFIMALSASGLKVVENDKVKYTPDTFKAVMAKRIVDHVSWCANTLNDSHGGFGSRLAKVNLSGQRKAIASYLDELATMLKNTYKVQYAPLYNSRNKIR